MIEKVFAVIALVILALFVVPAGASAVGDVPSYSATETGSATPGGTFTVAEDDADASVGLPSADFTIPVLLIWAASGALLLGIALVVVLSIVRRQRDSMPTLDTLNSRASDTV